MLPIPTHLDGILIPVGESNGENKVDGIIRCSCENETFHLKSNLETTYGEEHSLTIKVVCSSCNAEYLILDSGKHGWDGFVCHDGGEAAPDEVLEGKTCSKCNSPILIVKVGISSQGKQDFIDESGIADGEAEFNEDDWIDAFEWITVSPKCSACGYEEENWIDLETM